MSLNRSHLEQLISRWIDGNSELDQVGELQEMLRDSPEARTIYLSYMGIHAELNGTAKGKEYIDELLSDSLGRGQGAAEMTTRRGRNAGRWFYAVVAIAATLLIATVLGWLPRFKDRDPTEVAGQALENADDRVEIQATVMDASPNCSWYVEHSVRSANKSFLSGDVLRVASGKLKLFYEQGVEVTLHAPAAYQLLSATNSRVIFGRLTARVGEGGKGFSVVTPRATVVDLGTEFGVDVKGDGATDVVVFQGEVDVDYVTETQGETQQRRLRMGEAVRLDAIGTTSRIVSINNTSYDSALGSGLAAVRPPVISAVTDNISREESLNFYEIVHGGMREDALAFVDRKAHQYNGIDHRGMPQYLVGADYVKMFNNDKVNWDIRIDVTLAVPAKLYVLLDDRLEPPAWLRENFENTGDKIGIDVGPFFSKGQWHNLTPPGVGPGESVEDTLSVWVREVREPGTVHLGATEAPESGPNMYGIAAVPIDAVD